MSINPRVALAALTLFLLACVVDGIYATMWSFGFRVAA